MYPTGSFTKLPSPTILLLKKRAILKSGVSCGDDLEHVRKVALEEVYKIDAFLKDEVVAFYFTGIGSSTYIFEVRFWIRFTRPKDYLQ
ncbi:MAG: hypothetical protein AAGA86_08115, partial [Bacteroidota bacterium]